MVRSEQCEARLQQKDEQLQQKDQQARVSAVQLREAKAELREVRQMLELQQQEQPPPFPRDRSEQERVRAAQQRTRRSGNDPSHPHRMRIKQHTTDAVSLPAPPPVPWRDAAAVAVDNTPGVGDDNPDCGAPQKPCATISFGVSRAAAGATVTVRGGGAPYRGECGGSGIQPAAGDSLTIVGSGGRAVVDCEGAGRFLRFNASRTTGAAAMPGAGPTWRLVGLEVRNGKAPTAGGEDGMGGAVWAVGGGALALEGCAFKDCTASQGGALYTNDVQLTVSGSSFVRCATTPDSGGGMCVRFNADLVGLTAVSIDDSSFTDTASADSGGGARIGFFGNATGTTVLLTGTRFTNTSAITGDGGGFGGGLIVTYFGPAADATTAINGCTFNETRADNTGGGAYIQFTDSADGTTVSLRSTSFTNASAISGSGHGFSGGLQVIYGGLAVNATTAIDGCDFADTRTDSTAGGADIDFEGIANGTTISLTGTTFINTSAFSDDGRGGGGGFVVTYFGPAVDVTTAIDGCAFTDTRGGEQGGGGASIQFGDVANGATLRLTGTNFTNTSLFSDDGRGSGGGFIVTYFGPAVGATTTIDSCAFIDTRAGDSGGGAFIEFGGKATNTTVSLTGTSFTNTSATTTDSTRKTFAGGLSVHYDGQAVGAMTAIDSCTFTDTHAGYGGGGAYIQFGDVANGTTVSLVGTNFTNASAVSSADSGGGSIEVNYLGGPAVDAMTFIDGCAFTNTHAGYFGGGAFIQFNDAANGTTVRLTGTRFTNASVITGDGSGGGGGLAVFYNKITQAAATIILDTTFAKCSSDGGGGGTHVWYQGSTHINAVVLVDGARFEGNRVSQSRFDSDSGVGGGMSVQLTGKVSGASVDVRHSAFVGNNANGVGGGGGLSLKMPQGKPQNLMFIGNPKAPWRTQGSGDGQGNGPYSDDDQYDPFYNYPLPADLHEPCSGCGVYPNGCTSCPQFQPINNGSSPIIPLEHTYRVWGGSNNTFAIRSSTFANNSAEYQGGAIAVPGGGSGTIENTLIEGNTATKLFGGGAFVGGTVELKVINSTLRNNACGVRGRQLFSSSGAGIDFSRGSVVELGCGADGDCSVGFSAAQMGNVTWDGSAYMACPAGYQLLDGSAHGYSVTLDSWKLDPPSLFPPGCDLGSLNRNSGSHNATPFHSMCKVVSNKTNCPCFFSKNPYGGFYSAGFGTAPITPSILVSTLSYACRACPRNTYNPKPPMLAGTTVDSITHSTIGTCEPCPYGTRCEDGTFNATRGFWGSSSNGALSAFRCPAGYCCASDPCDRIDECMGNRTGVLCGACLPNFAQTIGSTACRAVGECGGADAAWFVPSALLLAVAFALYARKSRPGALDGWPLNAVQPLLYFYQMAQLLPVGAAEAHATLALLAGLFNMQLSVSGGNGFACPFPSLTTLQAIELYYAVPAVVLVLLALGYGAETQSLRESASKRAQPSRVFFVWLDYQLAVLKALALAFSTVLDTTFQLLHCVDLQPAAGSSMLFRAATVECGAWQAPFYLLAAALLVPVVVGLAVGAGVGAACTSKLPALPVAAASKLRAPYRYGCGQWEAVMALHRLCVVAVYNLVSSADSAVAAVLQTLICVAALVAHAACRPFSEPSANRTQFVLLLTLVIIALINVPQAMLDANAVEESAHAKALIKKLKDGEAVLLLAPALVVGTALLVLAWRLRRQLAAGARATCAALARCPRALCLPCTAGAEADDEAPLDEPLLADAEPGQLSPKLVSNSRGLRLTYRTPLGEGDEDEADAGGAAE
jgi:predicted outer membrane repeat protein